MNIKTIAKIENDFDSKFGIPRQSGLLETMQSTIIFEPEFRNPDALRGLEDFSRLWLIWEFSENIRETWHPTVRPPRFGGNERFGVFATRSPFRPNPIGLSCVEIHSIELNTPRGPVITVLGADLMNGTPVYDIKPYIPFADSFPDAAEGFASRPEEKLKVTVPDEVLETLPEEKRSALIGILECDPRPAYHKDAERIYGLSFAGYDIKFRTDGKLLTITEIEKTKE